MLLFACFRIRIADSANLLVKGQRSFFFLLKQHALQPGGDQDIMCFKKFKNIRIIIDWTSITPHRKVNSIPSDCYHFFSLLKKFRVQLIHKLLRLSTLLDTFNPIYLMVDNINTVRTIYILMGSEVYPQSINMKLTQCVLYTLMWAVSCVYSVGIGIMLTQYYALYTYCY